MSVVFVDIRGFTALSERVAPTEVAKLLNEFYNLASRVVFDLDGTLDKMVGDQVMAFFGPPPLVQATTKRELCVLPWTS